MAYIGKEPVRGQNRELDDISGSFNGSNTDFTMQVGGLNTSAGSVNQLFISVGGVLQNPGTDFTVAASTLTFTTPPANGLDFWGIIQGDAVDINTPADNSVTTAKILNNAVDGTKIAIGSDAQGDVLYYTGTDYARLPAGTSGDFLKTQGSGANPVWATVTSSDTLSFRNLIINGAMNVSQRGTTTTTSGKFIIDRFKVGWAGADEDITHAKRALSAVETGPWNEGFKNCLSLTNGNQTSGAGAADDVWIEYAIEDQDIACSGWQAESTSSKLTLSFWLKASVAQTYYVILETKHGTSKNYAFAATVAANTWTKITKTIPGHADISFGNDSGEGIDIYFVPFYGTNKTTSGHTVDAWSNTSGSDQAPDMTSTWWTTNDSTFEVTGVQLEVGSTATDFEHRSYGDELARCQRYFWQLINYDTSSIAVASMYSASDAIWVTSFPVTMRASPSIHSNINDNNNYLIGRWYNGTGGQNGTGNLSIQRVNHNTIMVYSAGWSLPEVGAFSLESNSSSCYLGFDAEL